MKSDYESSYIAAHALALNRLAELRQLIEDMPAPDSESVDYWGHVGTLNHICDQLAELQQHLGEPNATKTT